MNPDQIAILDLLRNGLREEAVRFLVCFPCPLVKGDLTGMIVEERPEN
jgi:hypothetical protein